MKGKGKGQSTQQGPAWGNPNPGKGKPKGNKGYWSPGKGFGGKGEKGAYHFMDDYSQGWSGYNFDDNALLSLQQEFMGEWQTPSPKRTFRTPSSCGGGCSHAVSGGRFAALA